MVLVQAGIKKIGVGTDSVSHKEYVSQNIREIGKPTATA